VFLTHLNISHNKLDTESSSMLGVFLTLTRGLKTLQISGTGPQFSRILASMMNGDKSQQCLTLTKLDCSQNSTGKERVEFVQLLKNFPNLTDLNVAGTYVTVEDIITVLKVTSSLHSLDISENDLSDQGIISFMKFLSTQTEQPIGRLLMNKVFNRCTADRPKAIEQIVETLNNYKIEELQLRGAKGNHALKDDLMDLIFGLINNEFLQKLDVTGHQAGDDLAIALGKVLARNNVLHTILWDLNDITLSGLSAIKLGLQRNSSIRLFELPFMDIFELRNKQDVDRDLLVSLIQDIQRIVSEINAKKDNVPVNDSKKAVRRLPTQTYSDITKACTVFRTTTKILNPLPAAAMADIAESSSGTSTKDE